MCFPPFLQEAMAQRWTTHFAYNNVTQIAVSPDKVYAISDGSLYSVEKQTEQIIVYNNQSGLHGTGISCIHYDEVGKQLIIAYSNGKIDLLSSDGVKYIGGLYDKDMTQRKTIYNVTIKGRIAYLSTHYGVQTLDLNEDKLVDSYWLRPRGQETPVKDVLLDGDSIYAFTDDSLFCASLQANLVDYTHWKREQRTGRISPDAEKGIHYKDDMSDWYAGQAEGIVRFTATERLTYKPDGPLMNIPYSICAQSDRVMVLAGGRWANRYARPGNIMKYDGEKWTYISQEYFQSKIGQGVLDFMNVIVDPSDKNHYFIPSYGTGLYEFRGDSLVNHFLPATDNTLTAAAPNNPNYYTRLSCAAYDTDGNLWMINDGKETVVQYELVCLDASGIWHGFQTRGNGDVVGFPTSTGLVIDAIHTNYKWMTNGREGACLCVLDNSGTLWDDSDDRLIKRTAWTDQNGLIFQPNLYYGLMQDAQGRIWMATDVGAGYFTPDMDCFASDAIILPDMEDKSGEIPLAEQQVNAFCQTPDGNIWIGTQQKGVFVLSNDATEIIAQYTPENSAMPSNCILSLASDENGVVWIGTAEGLVSFDPKSSPEGLLNFNNVEEDMEPGMMLRWRQHLSFSDAKEVVATPYAIYAISKNGPLYSFNRQDETITYWSKETGLNGSSIIHIAYDNAAGTLIIGYADGRIDLLQDNGSVVQMPDLYLKAVSLPITINSITVGSKYTYLAMPFGIVAINTHKKEVSDTYYIGKEASMADVQSVIELGDSLYAFGEKEMYSASLADNLADYTNWHMSSIPLRQFQMASKHKGCLYTLQHDSLYVMQQNTWQLVRSEAIRWMHASNSKLLVYIPEQGLFELTEDNLLSIINATYVANDAICSNGEYWLAEEGKGLIRLGDTGDDFFRPEGPMSNFCYHLDIAHNQLYVSPGGRWAAQFGRQVGMSIYDGHQWINIPWQDTWYYTLHDIRDVVGYAVDVNDPGHFFVATYGTGLFEFKNYKGFKHYDQENSTLRRAASTASDYYYTRTDGPMFDKDGNLWVLNATDVGQPVHVMSPNGIWHSLRLRNNGMEILLNTPSGIWIDKRNSRHKWMMDQRYSQRVILLDDGGTPTYDGDDKCMARSTFTDQNGNALSPNNFRCFVQDYTNRIWIGTEKGIVTIPASVDFFTSDACRRIIIPRNDGSGLGDYLLGDEQINCMAVDGGNRIWIGTANSGLYLIEDDTITVAHFTETNSLLPSNSVLSIAIMSETGEVFVGTDKGIASYRSDASEPQADMNGAYAFPNPVRPDYGGIISIAGLMDNTVVNIIDASGNLVCKTKSHGGIAVWDGKLPDGRRATPGVYTAMCNAKDGHAVVKILVIR